jgi:WD40 repeat protein
MKNLHRSRIFALALAAAVVVAPAVRGEKEKELLKTKARTAYVTPDGKILAAASKDNVRVVYLDIKKSRLIDKEYAPIALSPDGKFLLTVGRLEVDDGLVPAPVIDQATLEPGGALVISNTGIAFCLSPGGKKCAYSTRKDVVLADVVSGKILHTFTDIGGQPWSASFSRDGKYLACGTGTRNSKVVVWNTATFKTEQTFANMPDVIQAVTFTPDSKRLAASSDEVVKVWDVATGTEVRTFRGPKDKLMRGLAFGNSGKVLAAACSNGVVTLWDVATGKVLDTINVGVELFRVSMSDDGRVLAVTADDQFARIYDVSAAIGK